MERFSKISLNIQNLSLKLGMHHMVTTVRSRPFADSLCKKLAFDMDELRQWATKCMQLEELRDYQNQVQTETGVKKEKGKRKGKRESWLTYVQQKLRGPRTSFSTLHPSEYWPGTSLGGSFECRSPTHPKEGIKP